MGRKAQPAEEAAAVWVTLDALEPWKDNPRHNAAAVDEVVGSIRRFGFGAPIIARKADGMIIAGHTRYEAAKKLGLERVPVRYLDLDPADARLLALADNKLGEIAEWDDARLSAVLVELRDVFEVPLDVLEESGFSKEEVASLLADDGFGFGGGDGSGAGDGAAGGDAGGAGGDSYTRKIVAPIYEPKGPKPEVSSLYDETKARELVEAIDGADLPPDVAAFLRAAAARHTVFNYRKIADFYAHASPEVQRLFEDSALVIIDFDAAIENGFVRLTERLGELADREEAEAADA